MLGGENKDKAGCESWGQLGRKIREGKGREKKDMVRKRQRDPGETLALVFIPRHQEWRIHRFMLRTSGECWMS